MAYKKRLFAGATIAQDIIAYHAYPTTAGADPETYLLTQAYAIQTQMVRHGIGSLPLWPLGWKSGS
ncbi:MAG: hypothetical protein M0Z61_07645 [Nitrospiraceae bacterium]|nr:hypothetical protein [Nitrospiraceae bacterium]